MTVKLYAFTCGTVTGEFGRLMEGGEGDITLPVPVFLIEHPKGQSRVARVLRNALHPADAARHGDGPDLPDYREGSACR